MACTPADEIADRARLAIPPLRKFDHVFLLCPCDCEHPALASGRWHTPLITRDKLTPSPFLTQRSKGPLLRNTAPPATPVYQAIRNLRVERATTALFSIGAPPISVQHLAVGLYAAAHGQAASWQAGGAPLIFCRVNWHRGSSRPAGLMGLPAPLRASE